MLKILDTLHLSSARRVNALITRNRIHSAPLSTITQCCRPQQRCTVITRPFCSSRAVKQQSKTANGTVELEQESISNRPIRNVAVIAHVG
jgi:hypothetical protein